MNNFFLSLQYNNSCFHSFNSILIKIFNPFSPCFINKHNRITITINIGTHIVDLFA